MSKEWLSEIDCEVFDKETYPLLVLGHKVGQKTFHLPPVLEEDILIIDNPEKYPPQPTDQAVETPPVNPLQGEFKLWSK